MTIISLGATGLATWFMGGGYVLLFSLYNQTARFSARYDDLELTIFQMAKSSKIFEVKKYDEIANFLGGTDFIVNFPNYFNSYHPE